MASSAPAALWLQIDQVFWFLARSPPAPVNASIPIKRMVGNRGSRWEFLDVNITSSAVWPTLVGQVSRPAGMFQLGFWPTSSMVDAGNVQLLPATERFSGKTIKQAQLYSGKGTRYIIG